MLLTELLDNLFARPENRRREKSVRLAKLAEVAEQRCLLSATSSTPGFFDGSATSSNQGRVNPLTSIPQLSSLPGAPVTIYLDFDGHTETQDWPNVRTDGLTGPIVTPVFDIDNDFTTFSDEELRLIEEVWYRVAEDFMPFNVNVTTVDPGSYNDFEAVLVSFGGNGSWIGSPGGIAFVNSFSGGAVNTSYVFTDNTAFGSPIHAKGMALAASHEVGHMLGLRHHSVYDEDGNQTAQYDAGGPALGPIMGAPYTSEREIWVSAPDTNGPNSIQDDLAMMTRPQNLTFAYRADDYGNTIATAHVIPITGPNFSISGILERNNDIDFFRVETNTGNISFDVRGLDLASLYTGITVNGGTNADLVLHLYDSNGQLIASDDPDTSLSASLSVSVAAGTYFVAVTNSGEYGALGQYTLSGTVIPLPSTPVMLTPTGTSSSLNPLFSWTAGANAAAYELEVANLTLNRSRYYVRTVTGTSHLAQFAFVEGSYTARVRTVAADNTVSAWSNVLSFTLDVPAPAKPIVTRPIGEIATSFPTFIWNNQADATYYTLTVTNTNTNERIILRTNHQTNTYTHFNPIRDGNYSATVQAFNSVGEASPVSDPLAFMIDSPTPTAPTITAPTILTTNINPRIEWTPVEDAWRYDLWVNYRNQGVSQYIRDTQIEGRTHYDAKNLPQGTYNVWVRAMNGNGEVGPWSAAYTFSVDILPPDRPTMTGPAAVAPATTLGIQLPTFSWTAVDRAQTYDLWVNNNTTRQVQIIRNTSITGTSFTSLTTLPQGIYNAWVRGINAAGEVGAWSVPITFEIDLPRPTTPLITGPVPNPAGSVPTSTPTFTWTSEIPGDRYQLWIHDVTIGKRVLLEEGIQGQSYTIPVARRLQEHTYDVWVRGYNLDNEFSPWSTAYRVRINVPNPTTPVILGPGGTVRTQTPTLEWLHSSESVRYEVIIRDLERQENIVLQVTTFEVNPTRNSVAYTLPTANALGRGTYRFWVRAFNALGTASAWSTSRTFAVAATEPSEPSGQSPVMALDSRFLVTSLPAPSQRNLQADAISQPVIQDDRPAQLIADREMMQTTVDETTVSDASVVDTQDDAAVFEAVMTQFADPSDRLLDTVSEVPLVTEHHEGIQAVTRTEERVSGGRHIATAVLALLPFSTHRAATHRRSRNGVID